MIFLEELLISIQLTFQVLGKHCSIMYQAADPDPVDPALNLPDKVPPCSLYCTLGDRQQTKS